MLAASNRRRSLLNSTALIPVVATFAAAGLMALPSHLRAQNFGIISVENGAIETINGDGGGTIASPIVVSSVNIAINSGTEPQSLNTFFIVNGGWLTSNFTSMSRDFGSKSLVVVDGVGSVWENRNFFRVGIRGNSTVNVTEGGQIRTVFLSLGELEDSIGQISIDGLGSILSVSDEAIIGPGSISEGGTGILTLSNSGTFISTNGLIISSRSMSGTVNIGAEAGQPAAFAGFIEAPFIEMGNANATLVFNHLNTGYVLSSDLSGLGAIDQLSGETILTGNNTQAGNTTISGGTLQIGNGGATGTLGGGNVVNNASLVFNRAGNITVGNTISGTGTLTQQGPGQLTLTGANTFSGNTVLAGGTLSLGSNTALGASTLITQGSVVDFDEGVTIFNPIVLDSDTTQLQVLTGSATQAGVISEINGPRGFEKIGAGNLTLTAANTFTGEMRLTEGTLTLGNNLALPASSPVAITGGTLALGGFEASTASLNLAAGAISGPGTLGVVGDYVQSGGVLAAGASVNIGTGGRALLSGGSLAGTLNSTSTLLPAVIIDAGDFGVTGTLSAAGQLRVGDTNSGGLAISDGGSVSAASGVIAATQSSIGAVTIDGAGSILAASGSLQVGLNGTGRLDITNGASSTAGSGSIGTNITGIGAVTVNGPGSTLAISNFLSVGERGSGRLIISNGASVTSFEGEVGFSGGSDGVVRVEGVGSSWANTASLRVGISGIGSLAISDGAIVSNGTGQIGAGLTGAGLVTVDGAGSTWTNRASLLVGSFGLGNLDITNGGQVSNTFGLVGGAGTSGSVSVDGAGSAWVNSGIARIGERGTGSLMVRNAGAVSASEIVVAEIAGSNGTVNIGATADRAADSAGILTTPNIRFGAGTGSIVLNHTDTDFELSAAISGNGILRQISGTTLLSGANGGFIGSTNVSGGSLLVTGTLGGDVTVTGGLLGGTGTLTGAATIGSGGALAAGQSAGTFTMGSLALNAGSRSIFELGEAGVVGGVNNDLIRVTGELALNGGAIEIVQASGFSSGQYTLFEFGSLSGALGNLSLEPLGGGFVGNLALGDGTVLLNAASSGDLVWWNGTTTSATGAVVGGTGTWSSGGNNFTTADGTVSAPWAGDGSLAVFGGTAGTVTIAAGEVLVPSGLNFLTDGYVIEGGRSTLEFADATGIATASGVGATITAGITGAGSLTKTGAGTLTLTGDNTFIGRTWVMDGTLVNGGTIIGGLEVLSGATFNNQTDATLSGVSTISTGGTFTNSGILNDSITNIGVLTSSGVINGTVRNDGTANIEGILNGDVLGSGTVRLTGATTGINGLSLSSGGVFDLAGFDTTISLLAGGGSILLGDGLLTTGSDLSFSEGTVVATQFSGVISGSGGLAKVGSSNLTLTGNNTFTGGTTINDDGILQLGAGGTSGSIIGVVVNNGLLAVERSDAFTMEGAISGTGRFAQIGAGVTTLTANNSYTGGTTIVSGTLQVGNGGASGTLGSGDIINNAALVFNRSDDFTVANTVSGAGTLTKLGDGTLTLSGANTFTGGVTLEAGGLLVTGSLDSGVAVNGGTLGGTGTITGLVSLNSGGALAAGQSAGTFTMGSLALNAGSRSIFELGEAGVVGGVNNDLIRVTGELALNGGAIEIVQASGFSSGQYTLFEFGSLSGALGNLSLEPLGGGFVGNLALGDGTVLLNAASSGDLVWWNGTTTSATGAVVGGTGTWSSGGNNFTTADGTVSAPWAGDGSLAVFGGTAGTVTIAAGEVLVPSGLNFLTDGYVIEGGRSTLEFADATGIATASGVGATITAGITGAGSLTKTGAGTLTLTGDNTFIGLTAVLGGMLENTGALAGDVAVSASFVNAGSVAGALDVISGGTADNLAGAQVLGGATVGVDGTLSNTGSITGPVENAGTIGNVGNGTLSGPVINAGMLTSSGTIAGNITNSGTLTSIGTITGVLANMASAEVNLQGVLDGAISNAGNITLTGSASGIGTVTQDAGGVFDLAGNSIQIGSLAGSGSVLLGAATLTAGSDNASTSFAGVISGSGSLAKTGAGTLTLTGENIFAGGSIISGGALQLGDGGTSGTILGPVTNNGMLVVNRSDTMTLSNVIAGSGVLVQDGTGTTVLTGANTYTGGTLVSRGRLVGDTTSLQGAINNNAVLEFAMGANGTFAGALAGMGRVEKTGAGTLTFAGNGSALTGPFAVLSGGLRLDGRLDQSVVTLTQGTSLSGNGIIGGLIVESGALVTPGNSIGTISVAGDVTFSTGSRLMAEVTQIGADLISATGTARLAGALDIINIDVAGSQNFNRSFNLIEAAGGIEGSFDEVSFAGFSPIFRPTLRTTDNGLSLVLAPNSLAVLAGAGLSNNQAAVAARFDAAVAAGFDPQAFFEVYNLAPAELASALDQLSGEVHPAMGRAAMRQSRLSREAVLERAAGVAPASNPQGNSWGSWGKLMRSWGDVSADGAGQSGAASQQTDTEGFVIGFDGGTANDTRAVRFGVYGNYLNTRVQVGARGSSGQIEQAGGGVYTSLALGGFSLVAGGGAARFDITTDRALNLPGLAGGTNSASRGDMAQVFGRLGYRFDLGALSVEPFVSGDHAWIALDQTTERGGAAALSVGRQEYKVAGATTGIAGKVQMGKLRLDAEGGARFELGERTPQALLGLTAAPGQATRIGSTRLAGTAFTGRLGAVLQVARRIEMRIDYSGEFSSTDTEHAALAGISIAF